MGGVSVDADIREVGLLTDKQIKAEVDDGWLVVGNFDPENLHQACYELRASNIYYDLSDGNRRIVLEGNDYILLKPHQTIVVISHEKFRVPTDVVGRILIKGGYFSVGIQPVNTYADPGFYGNLGIILHNGSTNYLRIEQKAAIAKIAFERLGEAVEKPYVGQHGYQSQIWPIPTHLILRPEEISKDPRIAGSKEEIRRAYGSEVGGVIDRVFKFERALLLAAFAYIFLAVVIIVLNSSDRLSTISAFTLGLITNIVSSVLVFAATRIRRK